MSVRVMAQVWQSPCPSHTAKLVLLAIADNADDHGKAWPSITTIGSKCDLSRRSVMRTLTELEKAGLLTVKKEHGRGNVYTVKLVTESHQCEPVTGDAPSPTSDDLSPALVTHRHGTGDAPSPRTVKNHQLNHQGTTKARKSRKSAPVFDPLKLDLPHGDRFREAWALWCTHRHELGGKHRLKPTSTSQQLKRLGAMSESKAVETIEHTVANSWVGLREPEPPKQNGSPKVTVANPREEIIGDFSRKK